MNFKVLTSIPPGATNLKTESQYIILKLRKQQYSSSVPCKVDYYAKNT